ncbi:MAG: hypothetical protein FWG65_08390 [Turicibacter sp.]|nr:hypothetical protein [Turicibacter sp.]
MFKRFLVVMLVMAFLVPQSVSVLASNVGGVGSNQGVVSSVREQLGFELLSELMVDYYLEMGIMTIDDLMRGGWILDVRTWNVDDATLLALLARHNAHHVHYGQPGLRAEMACCHHMVLFWTSWGQRFNTANQRWESVRHLACQNCGSIHQTQVQ